MNRASLLEKASKPIRSAALRGNTYLRRYQTVIWVLGDGRSGTTWIQELLCWSWRYRMMYEPFHPASGVTSQHFGANLYLRPGEQDMDRITLAAKIFSGAYYHPNVDRDNVRLLYRGIVVKDIFAHMFAAWVAARLPNIRPILIVRNPFEVALSKSERRDWLWMTDARKFLDQPHLVEDHLEPYVDMINVATQDFVLQQVLIWSVMHFVLLRQFSATPLFCVRYEDVLASPETEISRLQAFVAESDDREPRTLNEKRISRPSRGSTRRTAERVADLSSRTSKLSRLQLHSGLQILDAFGLTEFAGLR